ncbi:unnamed protein product [Cunninghamella blakesleeana]
MEINNRSSLNCLLRPKPDTRLFQPQAEDILSDEELLDLFRIIKQILRKKPDAERIAKLIFCIHYSLGDKVKYYRPIHDDNIVYRDDMNIGSTLHAVRISNNPTCCEDINNNNNNDTSTVNNNNNNNSSVNTVTATDSNNTLLSHTEQQQPWKTPNKEDNSISNQQQLSVSYLTHPTTTSDLITHNNNNDNNNNNSSSNNDNSNTNSNRSSINILDHTPDISNEFIKPSENNNSNNNANSGIVRPYTNIRPMFFSSTTTHHHHHSAEPETITSIRYDERNDHLTNNNNSSHPHHIRLSSEPIISSTSTTSPTTTDNILINNHNHTDFNLTTDDSTALLKYQQLNSMLHAPMPTTRIEPNSSNQVVMEPKQRGFYYQYGRIDREPPLLRRFAEQGVLTQASLLRKRRRQCSDADNPYILATLPAPTKKPKIPHRHGEFEQRRDDIIHRMRSITLSDLEQKSQRLPPTTTLSIEIAQLPENINYSSLTTEESAELLEPALRILTFHSNMKPHLDNGMNQNGIYYNVDYYRLYLAFVQFQKTFATLFPHEVVKVRNTNSVRSNNNNNEADDEDEYDPLEIPVPPSSNPASVSAMSERDRDRDRNMNMKAYRGWIEPLLTETNWAAFRRNIVVGERMVLLTKVVGQGVLLMTKELSGSKLHLTFTNSEWDEFIGGLHIGKWDETINWDDEDEDEDYDDIINEVNEQNNNNNNNSSNNNNIDNTNETNTISKRKSMNHHHKKKIWGIGKSRLVEELKNKFLSEFWFNEIGSLVPSQLRRRCQEKRRQEQTVLLRQLQLEYQEKQQIEEQPSSLPPPPTSSQSSSNQQPQHQQQESHLNRNESLPSPSISSASSICSFNSNAPTSSSAATTLNSISNSTPIITTTTAGQISPTNNHSIDKSTVTPLE